MRHSAPIQWKKVKAGALSEREQTDAVWNYALVSAAVYLLSLWSGVRMILDVFTDRQVGAAGIGRAVLLIIGVQLWQALAPWRKGHWWDKAGRTGLTIGVPLWLLLYGLRHGTEVAGGGLFLLSRYLQEWNQYYQTNIYLGTGIYEKSVFAMGFLVLVCCAVSVIAGMWTKKQYSAALFPTLVLIVELLVGYTPGWFAVALWVMVLTLVHRNGWQERTGGVRPVVWTGVLMVVVAVLVNALLAGPATAIKGQEKRMLAFQHRIEDQIMSAGWISLFAGDNTVDNHTPKYTGSEVLQVEVNTLMTDNLYLRASYGGYYDEHTWREDDRGYREQLAVAGFDEESAAMRLAALPYHSQTSLAGGELPDQAAYEITYTGTYGSDSYLPYGIDPQTSQVKLAADCDFHLLKPWRQDMLTVTGMALTEYPLYEYWDSMNRTLEVDLTDEEREFCDFYNGYAQENYMEIPAGQTSVAAIAKELKKKTQAKVCMNYTQSGITYLVNYGRIFLADVVKTYLAKEESYSLNLDKLASGVDPVEYFLGTSHEGYCVHFASAGVLLLRELGVPCRYASGYVAKSSAFQEKKEEYVCSVRDNNAHAWVEIYLDDYGWFPIDVTAGTAAENQSFEATLNQARSEVYSHGVQVLGEGVSDEEKTDTKQTDTPKQEADDALQQANEAAQQAEKPADPSGGTNTNPGGTKENGTGSGVETGAEAGVGSVSIWGGEWTNLYLRGVATMLCVLAVIGVVYVLWTRKQKLEQRRISSLMKRGSYTLAVRRMNRQLYQQLKRDRRCQNRGLPVIGTGGGISDDETYQAELQKTYAQIPIETWERYMEIARKAVYSKAQLNAEEANLVREVITQLHPDPR